MKYISHVSCELKPTASSESISKEAKMAAQRLEINRGASPMFYTEERIDETKDQLRDRINKLENDRKKKTRILYTFFKPGLIDCCQVNFPILSPPSLPYQNLPSFVLQFYKNSSMESPKVRMNCLLIFAEFYPRIWFSSPD